MQINPQNVFNPFVTGAGLAVSVSSGSILISGLPTTIPPTIAVVSPSTTSYIYLSLTTGLVNVTTSGFPATNAYTIATVTANSTNVTSIVDSRPDLYAGVANATGAVLLTPSGNQHVVGFPFQVDGFVMNVVSETTNYVALATDNLILADATSGPLQITLPTTSGAFYRVIKIDSSVNVVTIVSASGTLNGAANKQLTVQWQSADVQGHYVFGGGGGATTGGFASTVVGFSATPTFAVNNVAVQQFVLTLTGDVTSSTLTGLTAGQQVVFVIAQDGSGNHQFVWPSNAVNPLDMQAPSSQAPNSISIQPFLVHSNGTTLYPMSAGSIN